MALLLFVHILRGTTLTAQHSERVDRPERWNPPRRSKSMGRVASAPRRPHPVLPSPGDQAWILQIFILLCRFEHADHLLLGSGCRRTRGQSSLLACSEHYDKARGCGRLSSGGSGAAVGADDLATEAIFDPSSSTLGGQSVIVESFLAIECVSCCGHEPPRDARIRKARGERRARRVALVWENGRCRG